jgi:hypothetical protein
MPTPARIGIRRLDWLRFLRPMFSGPRFPRRLLLGANDVAHRGDRRQIQPENGAVGRDPPFIGSLWRWRILPNGHFTCSGRTPAFAAYISSAMSSLRLIAAALPPNSGRGRHPRRSSAPRPFSCRLRLLSLQVIATWWPTAAANNRPTGMALAGSGSWAWSLIGRVSGV